MSVAFAHSPASQPDDVTVSATPSPDAWDRYVRAHEAGSFFHLSGWGEVVRRAYGYEPVYLTARRGEAVAGVLPLVDVTSPLLGRSLISTPFTIGGGPLADDEEALGALLSSASAIGAERRAKYIECRSDFTSDNGWLEKKGIYATFKTPLPQDETEHFNSIPRKRRAEIRKALTAAEKGELSIRYDGGVDEFYAIYACSLHRLGTPVFPKRFLHSLVDVFGNAIEIAVVEYQGAPVAALLSFYFRDSVLPYYAGATGDALRLRANDFLYWSMMRRAAARGRRTFDFGRSKLGSGSYHYKKLWGCAPAPLVYRVKLIESTGLPNVNPQNPKFAFFARLWPQLPLPAANALGPLLAPNFP